MNHLGINLDHFVLSLVLLLVLFDGLVVAAAAFDAFLLLKRSGIRSSHRMIAKRFNRGEHVSIFEFLRKSGFYGVKEKRFRERLFLSLQAWSFWFCRLCCFHGSDGNLDEILLDVRFPRVLVRILYCTILRWIDCYCTRSTPEHCTTPYCTAVYSECCTVLHCTASIRQSQQDFGGRSSTSNQKQWARQQDPQRNLAWEGTMYHYTEIEIDR